MSMQTFLAVGACLHIVIHFGMIQGCIFKTREISNTPKKVAYEENKPTEVFTRRNTTNLTCECGYDAEPYSIKKPWMLYLHFNTTKGRRICPGTIVNSNMVLASHSCLRKSDTINKVTFPIKAKKVMNFPKAEEIILSNETDLSSKNATFFKIEKIIYRDEYAAEYVITGANAPESDVAVLVVKHNQTDVDFNFNNARYSKIWVGPICVPKWREIPMDLILNKEGFYQGVRGWDDRQFKYTIGVGDLTAIKTAKQCSDNKVGERVFTNSDASLCLEYVAPGPTTEGGPLRFTVMSNFEEVEKEPEEGKEKQKFVRGRSYLIGIATHVDRSLKNAHHKYAYFNNINSIAKYIEKTALEEKSEWCETPPFFGGEYPWNDFEEGQDESLNCDCGKDLPAPGSRIFDGTQANKSEFPWLIKFIIPQVDIDDQDRYQETQKICAGTIINSRVILTAANCITDSDLITAHGSNFNILDHDSWNYKVPLGFNKQVDEFYAIYVFSHYLNPDYDTNPNLPDTYPPGTQLPVEQIIFHPRYPEEYLNDRFNFDIALIIIDGNLEENLEKPEDLDWQLRQICLPKAGDLEKVIKEKTSGTVAGWGGEEPALNIQAHYALTKTTVQVHEFDFCAQQSKKLSNDSGYEPYNAIQLETSNLICASAAGHLIETSSYSNPTPYHGDNGAPLMFQLESGRTTQVGVFSHFVYHSHKNYIRRDPLDENVTSVGTTLKGVTYYQNVEPLLPFINYYSKQAGAKGCRQRH